jgi:hypothetical protein
MMTFIIQYWQQLLLVLSALGFVIVKFLELRLKRHEIKYNLFQKEKINRLMRYYDSLIAFDRMTFDFIQDIPAMSMTEFENRMKELHSCSNDFAATTIPFKFLGDDLEYNVLSEVRIICNDFLRAATDNEERMDSNYAKQIYNEFVDKFRPAVAQASLLLRKKAIKTI